MMNAVCGHWRTVWTARSGFIRCPLCEIEKQPFFAGVSATRSKKLLT